MTIEVANESGIGIDEIGLVSVARWVLAHRLVLKPEAALDGETDLGIVGAILDATPVPR